MWTKIAFLIGLALVSGLGYQKYQLTQENEALKEQIKKLEVVIQKEKSAEKTLAAEVALEKQKLQGENEARLSDLQKLATRISGEQGKLAELETRLKEVSAKSPADGSSLQTQIQNDQDRLKKLNARLSEYKKAEKEASQEGQQSLQQGKVQGNSEVSKIDAEIKQQQQVIKETNKQIAIWKKRKHDINQNSNLVKLSKDLEEQQQVLSQLTAEKLHSRESEAQRSQVIKNTMAMEKENLQDTEGQIREQIKITEADLKQLRGSANRVSGEKTALNNQKADLQKQVKVQVDLVHQLTEEYEQKRKQVEGLPK